MDIALLMEDPAEGECLFRVSHSRLVTLDGSDVRQVRREQVFLFERLAVTLTVGLGAEAKGDIVVSRMMEFLAEARRWADVVGKGRGLHEGVGCGIGITVDFLAGPEVVGRWVLTQ